MYEYAIDILEFERLRLFKAICKLEEIPSTYENHVEPEQIELITRRFDELQSAIDYLSNPISEDKIVKILNDNFSGMAFEKLDKAIKDKSIWLENRFKDIANKIISKE